jgi:hypothetical protein
MRRAAIAVLVFAAAPVMFADEAPRLDYSREGLLRLFSPQPGHVQWHAGYFDFRALSMHWRVLYLPIAKPVVRLEDEAMIPNPFELTGTPYASTMPPAIFDYDRSWELEQEYRRIERLTKEQKVEVREQ